MCEHGVTSTSRRTVMSDELIARPDSCPRPGVIEAFDAGWNAHEVGLERETVAVFAADPAARPWALMAWDVRQKLAQGKQ
jgi:hypothetical protein